MFYLIYLKINTPIGKNTWTALLLMIFISLFVRTIVRNQDWKDPITFYSKSLKQSPDNLPMRHNLAMTYAQMGNLDYAIEEYNLIISKADIYPNTHHNLANAYKEKGLYKQAEEEYYKALQIDPKFLHSYAGLVDLYKKSGEKDKLEAVLKKIESLPK
jgi:tetratricopeptide (TPR) repeat protein